MTHLYVAHFSNGHIKVGRSIDPASRIASHADRVSCVGVELVESFCVECIGLVVPAESALVERCATYAAKRHKSEWFTGLEFTEVCAWAEELARVTQAADQAQMAGPITGIQKAVGMFDSSPAKLASAVGCGVLRQHVEHWLRVGRVSAEKCPDVSAVCGIPCEELNDKVNWGLVRKAVSAPSRPKSKEVA